MTLRVVGAGLGRTGTHSLKLALEQLLGGPCYHMAEVFQHPEHIARWQDAVDGRPVDWAELMHGYHASVDWPAASFWPQLAATFPDAIVLLSTRASAQAWWDSADQTIFAVGRRGAPPDDEMLQSHHRLIMGLFGELTPEWSDAAAAQRAYELHNASVRTATPPERLVEWQPGDGWAPLCNALGLAVPDSPFPHANTTDEFRTMTGLA